MITMEFDEMKKIWDSQNNEPLYVINEKALYDRILVKRKQAQHITNTSELLLIIVNIIAGCLVLGMNFFDQSGSIFMYFLSAWMFGTALYSLISRIRRIRKGHRYDRTLHGDLDHAISVATYQVRLSQIMRWNILPLGTLILLGIWDSGKSVWIAGAILVFFVLVYYASAWEHNIYKNKKRELETLQNKLEDEAPNGGHLS